jgi:TfoX/Sxy family transcriptional regulator of competence genes
MAYDQVLAGRARSILTGVTGMEEKKMFGGVGFLVHGNMACGVHGNDLIVRVGPDRYTEAMEQLHTKVFDMTGKPMTGWILVTPSGVASDAELEKWVNQSLEFAKTLPGK